MKCPKCQASNPAGANFCSDCGTKLQEKVHIVPPTDIVSERKHVTVLFSDVSGYTAMSEKLDPEEVTELMSRIFGEVTRVVNELEGSIDKFIGDAVLAVFGMPKAHEDDAVRAIMAARKIHQIVDNISPEVESRIGRPLTMHTGINSGLIVTGEMNVETGKAGIIGDTINLASRLEGLAEAGDILVGPDTCHEAEWYYTFEDLGTKKVKGKAEPMHVYRVLAQREHPEQVGHLHGVRAEFIGRSTEMAQLRNAVEQVKAGRGAVVTICGDAGTGKSRLVEEFKATLISEKVQWFEGHAYAYRQQTPYAPLIDFLAHVFQVEERDPPNTIREKLETGLQRLLEDHKQVVPYIGSLFSLRYPEIEEVSPEFWKARLHDGSKNILSALAEKSPSVICFEDLHWADPSSIELLRSLFPNVESPLLFLCVYRPTFSLLMDKEKEEMSTPYQEIRLHDLSSSDTKEMLHSLLQTEHVPSELETFVQEKVEGNPFYMEEVVNALIDTEILVQEGCNWKMTKSISEADIPSTIQGVLTARLDRLKREVKRILQEASVIGRSFFYEILNRITEYKTQIASGLSDLQRSDFIRLYHQEPELEYIFKHALTQEVAYNVLLKKERRVIHERIGLVMEQVFHDRLPDFYEALAFHFKQGNSPLKAVEYLMKSGEKNLRRYSIEESHSYYKEAYLILKNTQDKSHEENTLLIDLIMQWALVYYYRGDFKGLTELIRTHEDAAVSLDDKSRLGMYYAWLGFSLYGRSDLKNSKHSLLKSLKIGEEIGSKQIIGYACTWLTFLYGDLGLFKDALNAGERALNIARSVKSEQYLFFKPLAGIIQASYYMGDVHKARESGSSCLGIGKKYSNVRAITMGHIGLGMCDILLGDLQSAIEIFKRAHNVSADRMYKQTANLCLGLCYIQNEQFDHAGEVLQEVINYSQEFGCEWAGTPASMLMGTVLISSGEMSLGFNMIESAHRKFIEYGNKPFLAVAEYILGRIYLQMVEAAEPIRITMMLKNIGFLIRNLPFAAKKAEQHLQRAIEMAKEIEAKGTLGQAYLDLGLLYKAKKKPDQAKECIFEAITIFKDCGAEGFLERARGALASL